MKSKRFLCHIKRLGNKVATFLKSREVVTFLFFFVLAFFLWYMYSMGTQREITRRIPISYIGIPDNVQLEKELPQELKFVLKDEGKIIWSYQKSLFDTLKIDLTNHFDQNDALEIKFEEHFQKILTLLSPTTKVIELNPSYFTSKYIRLYSKSVPVVTSNVIKLAPQHVATRHKRIGRYNILSLSRTNNRNLRQDQDHCRQHPKATRRQHQSPNGQRHHPSRDVHRERGHSAYHSRKSTTKHQSPHIPIRNKNSLQCRPKPLQFRNRIHFPCHIRLQRHPPQPQQKHSHTTTRLHLRLYLQHPTPPSRSGIYNRKLTPSPLSRITLYYLPQFFT